MNKTIRWTVVGTLAAALLVFAMSTWAKDKERDRDREGGKEKERVTPVTDTLTLKRCGDCHLAYPAAFLPQRSWAALMGKLDGHFGEDASLPDAERKQIEAYLTANAGDRVGSKMLRGLSANVTPLRITELPRWVREHEEELSASVWTLPSVKSRSNCAACHVDAAKGDYSERNVKVPRS